MAMAGWIWPLGLEFDTCALKDPCQEHFLKGSSQEYTLKGSGKEHSLKNSGHSLWKAAELLLSFPAELLPLQPFPAVISQHSSPLQELTEKADCY